MTTPNLAFAWTLDLCEAGIPMSETRDNYTRQRYHATVDELTARGLLSDTIPFRSVTREDLELVHPPHYIDKIIEYCGPSPRGDDFTFVCADTAIDSNTYDLARLQTGTNLAAVEAVVTGKADRSFTFSRFGAHHVYATRGGGFGIFNCTAVPVRYAQRHLGVGRVAIIDFDVHHGNGTQSIFTADPSVFTFSIHQYGGSFYPRTGHSSERGTGPGQGSNLNVNVEAGTRDRAFLAAFQKGLKSIRGKFDLVIAFAGFDGHEDDPVGGLRLSDRVYPELATRLLEWSGGKLVSYQAGGYEPRTIGALTAGYVEALAG